LKNGAYLTTNYALDGKETKNDEIMVETRSVAEWNKNRLTIVTRDPADRELKRILYLNADGGLDIETFRDSEHYVSMYGKTK